MLEMSRLCPVVCQTVADRVGNGTHRCWINVVGMLSAPMRLESPLRGRRASRKVHRPKGWEGSSNCHREQCRGREGSAWENARSRLEIRGDECEKICECWGQQSIGERRARAGGIMERRRTHLIFHLQASCPEKDSRWQMNHYQRQIIVWESSPVCAQASTCDSVYV